MQRMVIAALLPLGSGCGGMAALHAGDGGADAGPADVACGRYAEIYCEGQGRCFSKNLQWAWGDLATCRDRVKLGCLVAYSAPGSRWTPVDQDACNLALSGRDCAAVLTTTPPECRKAGDLATGARCVADVQCQGAYCKRFGAYGCGTCSQRQPVGGTCTGFSPDCQDGLYCSTGQVCAPYRKLGEACDNIYLICDVLLACIPDGAGARTCQPPRGPGEPCDSGSAECAYFPDELECRALTGTTGTCHPLPPLPSPGERCEPSPTGQSFDLRCGGTDDCEGPPGQEVCTAALADGSPCHVGGPRCRPWSSCREGYCRFNDPSVCR